MKKNNKNIKTYYLIIIFTIFFVSIIGGLYLSSKFQNSNIIILKDDKYMEKLDGKYTDNISYLPIIKVNKETKIAEVEFVVPFKSNISLSVRFMIDDIIIGETGMIYKGNHVNKMDIDISKLKNMERFEKGVLEFTYYVDNVPMKQEKKDITVIVV